MSTPPPRHSQFSKPVIGIVGGVGSGKSLVAKLFADLGCGVLDSDKIAHEVLHEPAVKAQLRAWWGDEVFDAAGEPDRRKIGQIVFRDPEQKRKLEALVHPRVAASRDSRTAELVALPLIRGVVWDTPLLFEVGIDRLCDAVVFVKAPYQQRLERVTQTRGWSAEELAWREKMQFPLDKKADLADYSVDNSGEVATLLRQVRDVFSQILARKVAPA